MKHCRITKMMWSDILAMLKLRAKDLLDRSDPKYQKEIAGHDFDDEGWLEILSHNPCLLKAPIAVMQGNAVLCIKPKDILKLSPQTASETA
jgi:arsenate reductase